MKDTHKHGLVKINAVACRSQALVVLVLPLQVALADLVRLASPLAAAPALTVPWGTRLDGNAAWLVALGLEGIAARGWEVTVHNTFEATNSRPR